MEEIWKPITGYEALYDVSNLGRVRGLKYPMIRKAMPTWSRYLQVNLFKDGEYRRFSVHSLVAQAFIGPRPKGKQINHKNGDRTDNRVDNLEWVTQSENNLHAFRVLGRKASLSKRKLTDDQIKQICLLLSETDLTNVEIAKRFGITDGIIYRIRHKKIWKSFLHGYQFRPTKNGKPTDRPV